MMTASRLLKSWATPPVSWPTASMRWTCRSFSSMARRSVTSRAQISTPPMAGSPSRPRAATSNQRQEPLLCRKRSSTVCIDALVLGAGLDRAGGLLPVLGVHVFEEVAPDAPLERIAQQAGHRGGHEPQRLAARDR